MSAYFSNNTLFSANRAITCSEELDIAVKLDSSDERVALVDILQALGYHCPVNTCVFSSRFPPDTPHGQPQTMPRTHVAWSGLGSYRAAAVLATPPAVLTCLYARLPVHAVKGNIGESGRSETLQRGALARVSRRSTAGRGVDRPNCQMDRETPRKVQAASSVTTMLSQP